MISFEIMAFFGHFNDPAKVNSNFAILILLIFENTATIY